MPMVLYPNSIYTTEEWSIIIMVLNDTVDFPAEIAAKSNGEVF
jgi:hypothetical protein